jgi:hypothetical protein
MSGLIEQDKVILLLQGMKKSKEKLLSYPDTQSNDEKYYHSCGQVAILQILIDIIGEGDTTINHFIDFYRK